MPLVCTSSKRIAASGFLSVYCCSLSSIVSTVQSPHSVNIKSLNIYFSDCIEYHGLAVLASIFMQTSVFSPRRSACFPPPYGKEGPVFTGPSQSVLFHWGSFIDHTAAGFTGFGIIVFPGAVGIRAGPASVRVNIGHGSVRRFDDFRSVNQVVVVEVSILDIRPGIGRDVIGAVNINLIDRA